MVDHPPIHDPVDRGRNVPDILRLLALPLARTGA
jgi:hypothetical protein